MFYQSEHVRRYFLIVFLCFNGNICRVFFEEKNWIPIAFMSWQQLFPRWSSKVAFTKSWFHSNYTRFSIQFLFSLNNNAWFFEYPIARVPAMLFAQCNKDGIDGIWCDKSIMMVSSSYVRHENAPVYGCVRVRPPYTERATYWCCCNECICHECALLFSVRCNIQIWLPPLLLSPSSTYLNRSVCGIARKVDCFIRPGQTFATQIKTKVYHMLWWKWASLRPINRIYFIWKNRKTLGHVGVRAFNQKSAYIKWNNLCAMSSFGLVKTSFYKLSTMFLVYLYVIWISAHTHTI